MYFWLFFEKKVVQDLEKNGIYPMIPKYCNKDCKNYVFHQCLEILKS